MSALSSVISTLTSLSIATFMLCQFKAAADEPGQPDNAAQKPNWHVIGEKETPDSFPLVSVGGEACLNLKLYDLEIRKLNLSLKNIADKPVKIKRIIPGCPCLSLQSAIADYTLSPNSQLPVVFFVNAQKLHPGVFDKFFYVEIDGFESPAKLPVKGEVKEIFKYEPNKIIQLGTFIGDVPWSRTFTIESILEPDKVEIKPPEQNQHLNIEVKKESPTVFKVTVSPKGKLPPKKLKELIRLPVEGIPDYGPIELGILGNVTGWALTLENNSFVFSKTNIDHDAPMTVETKVIMKSEKPRKPSYKHRGSHDKKDNPSITTLSVAENEEKQTRPLTSPETWKPLVDEITIEHIPENVKLDKIPSSEGIILKLTLPSGFFNSSTPFINAPVKFKGNLLSYLKVASK